MITDLASRCFCNARVASDGSSYPTFFREELLTCRGRSIIKMQFTIKKKQDGHPRCIDAIKCFNVCERVEVLRRNKVDPLFSLAVISVSMGKIQIEKKEDIPPAKQNSQEDYSQFLCIDLCYDIHINRQHLFVQFFHLKLKIPCVCFIYL